MVAEHSGDIALAVRALYGFYLVFFAYLPMLIASVPASTSERIHELIEKLNAVRLSDIDHHRQSAAVDGKVAILERALGNANRGQGSFAREQSAAQAR